MKTRTLKQLLLYNYRYLFAYAIIIGFMAYFLGWQLGQIGPGLSAPELATAARHTSLSEFIKLPIYPVQALLQWASISLFGISPLALRLPSVLIALLVAITLYSLLKKWFGRQTALLSAAILISSDWFLFTARLGTGSIEFSLWLVLALLCFTKLLEHKTNWLMLFAITLVGLLFTPLGPYASMTLIFSLFSCRVFRERAVTASLVTKIVSTMIFSLGLGLVLFLSITNAVFLKNILRFTTIPSLTEYIKNSIINTAGVVAVLPDGNPVISTTGVFFVRFFELIFILFGIVMLWKTRVNRLNLTVIVVSVVLVLASGLSSGSRGGSVVFIPAAIFMTAGIRHLMHRWKRTFPKNPYARVAAFVPLGVLFICVVALHYFSYFWLWPSQTSTHQAFSKDLQLAVDELNKPQHRNQLCFVETTDKNVQKLLIASKTTCTVTFPDTMDPKDNAQVQLLQPTSIVVPNENNSIRALVSETKESNVRWLVVTSTK